MKHGIGFVAIALGCAGIVPAAPPLQAARTYVESIYRSVPAAGFDYRSVRYARELGMLMRRDADYSRRSGDVGVLDWVPFCECQDTDERYGVVRSSVSQRDGRATVAIILRNGGLRRFQVDLNWIDASWRIADVHGPHTPSLLSLLRREVPKEEATLRQRLWTQ